MHTKHLKQRNFLSYFIYFIKRQQTSQGAVVKTQYATQLTIKKLILYTPSTTSYSKIILDMKPTHSPLKIKTTRIKTCKNTQLLKYITSAAYWLSFKANS